MDEEGMLEQYCVEMGVSSMKYRPAKEIFLDRSETTEEESNSNEAVDMTMKELVGCVSVFFQRSRAANIMVSTGETEVTEDVMVSEGVMVGDISM
ncbi:hypothetical protein BGZ58_006806, partial [Dissophora ornata]